MLQKEIQFILNHRIIAKTENNFLLKIDLQGPYWRIKALSRFARITGTKDQCPPLSKVPRKGSGYFMALRTTITIIFTVGF